MLQFQAERWLTLLALGWCGALSVSAQSPPTAAAAVLETLTASCAACHNGETAQGGLRLHSLAALAEGGSSGPAIHPGDPTRSPLVQRISSPEAALRMPPIGPTLRPDQIALIAKWVDDGAPGLPAPPAIAAVAVSYERDVQPILERSCYACHSGAQPKSQLRLDRKAGMLQGGIGGPAIVIGDSAASRLVHRIEGHGGEQRMPLGGEPLSRNEVAVLRNWIDSGAEWAAGDEPQEAGIETHWAYRKPSRPPVPVPKNAGLVANPIDAFVLARLEEKGLSFSPAASHEALIRRVSLDLTGLPPSPEDVRRFVEDPRADAYQRLVESLLGSPHYGERWARPWLDYARYADTNGYEKDRRRSIWKYRDWVIGALNADMPFDQFSTEQIAGDMLPDATTEQKTATGFHRNTMLTEEGGVDKDEARFEVLVDRVNTTAMVWLGSTLACAQCHNHKYDPFMQRDYYRMMAFFNHGEKRLFIEGNDTQRWLEPELDLATLEQAAKRDDLNAKMAAIEAILGSNTPELEREQQEWERSLIGSRQDWLPLAGASAKSSGGATLAALPDGSLLASGPNAQIESYVVEGGLEPGRLAAFRLEALPDESLPGGGPGRDIYGNFVVSEFFGEIERNGVWEQLEFGKLFDDNGTVRKDRASEPLWSVDASREEKRFARQLVLVLREPIRLDRPARARVTLKMNGLSLGQSIGRFRLSATGAADPARIVNVRHHLRPLAEMPASSRTAEQRKELADLFRSVAPSLKAKREEFESFKNQLKDLGIVSTLVMAEVNPHERPFDHIRLRGGFSAKGEKVYANTPVVLNPLPDSVLPNRLGLARWLVSEDNPLTARVTVNRIWAQYFGKGIVETVEDFGSQGAAPTHPALLDWLAVEFMSSGWRMKDMHRLIVTSNAYRQSSRVTPELLKADPDNTLLSRGPRFRLEAEMIRDTALAASGLLNPAIGGPSVFPYQPEGVHDIPYNGQPWEESNGADRYRRAIYTFVQRTAMYPSQVAFDMNSREFCSVRRTRTNTPLQALNTLNDPAFFEMAQALASRALREGGRDDAARIDYAFRLVTSRAPTPSETVEIQAWLEKERARFERHAEQARRLAPDTASAAGVEDTAGAAAWVMLANTLLNLDEVLTKQ
ncbi:MAG: PSD1 and planctomycete cytochrome C domain-containing protein [Bryobacterales bacterium]